MNEASFTGMAQNVALLAALVIILGFTTQYQQAGRLISTPSQGKRTRTAFFIQAASGILIGGIGVMVMLTPWVLVPGIVFDTRSVLLVISGLFFGVVPTSVAMLVTASYRLYLGGEGALTGVLVILAMGTLGIAWRHARSVLRIRRPLTLDKISGKELYILGLLAHVLMLLIMFTLPLETALQVLHAISIPVLILYPLATLLIGLLLRQSLKNLRLREELLHSETRLNATQQLSMTGGWEYTSSEQSMFWTDETYRIHGIDPKTIPPGSRFHIDQSINCYKPEDRPIITEAFQKCCTEGVPYDLDFPFTTVQGEAKWIRTQAEAVMDDGKVIRVIGNMIDITEGKNAERALQESEQKWRNILVRTPQVGVTLDPQAAILFANDYFLKLTGWREEEILGRNWFDLFIPEEIREEIRSVFDQVMHQRDPFGYSANENEILTHSGERRNIAWSNVITKNMDGEVVDVTCLGIDLTERKQAENDLRQSEERFRVALKNSSITVFNQDRELRYSWLYNPNPGFAPQSVLGKTDAELFPADEAAILTKIKSRVLETGVGSREEVRTTINGQVFFHDLNVEPLQDLNGKIAGVTCSSIDITESKQSEENLRVLSEMLDVAPNSITIHDIQGNFLYANQKCFELHGYSHEEFMTNNLHQLDVPESEALINERIHRIQVEGSAQFEAAHFKKDGSIIPLEIFVKNVIWKDQPALMSIATDITERKKTEGDTNKRHKLVEATANISSLLLRNLSPEDNLKDVVRSLGEASGQDRVYYFSWNPHPGRNCEVTISLIEEWVQEGVLPQIINPVMQKIPFSQMAPYSYNQLLGGHTVSTFVEELPVSEREFLEPQGIISILLVPIMVNGAPRGIIGFDNCHSKYSWYLGEKDFLLIVADNIANAILRWETEEMVRTSNETARAILNSATESVFLMNLEGTVITANNTTAHRLGVGLTDLIGANIYDFLPSEIARSRKHQIEQFIQTGHPCLFEDERSGIWFENSLYPVFDHSGKIDQVAIYGRDITERKMTERKILSIQDELKQHLFEAEHSRQALLSVVEDQIEAEEQVRQVNKELELRVKERTAQLELANRELEAFSFSVSHDLRAPLRALTGFSEALTSEYQDQLDQQAQKYLQRIGEASQRMGHLIDDLLNLSRVSRKELVHQKVNLSELAISICAELKNRQPERLVEINITADLLADGDKNLLSILLENLINNAFKFTGRCERALIQVGSKKMENEKVFFVRDNGAGFDMAYANKLFTPFQRLHTESEFPGTGIGLSIVQRIISKHDGRIWVESSKGQGTTFFFTLGGHR